MCDQARVDDAGDECGYRYDEREDAGTVAAFDDRTEQYNERHIRDEVLPIGMPEHVRKEAEIVERRFPIERMAAVLSARYDKKRRRKVPVEHVTVEQHNYRTDDDKGKRNGRVVGYADFSAYFGMFLHGDSIVERTSRLKRFLRIFLRI